MLSVDLNDEDLRSAGYELLGAVCQYLNFDRSSIVAAKCMCAVANHTSGTDLPSGGLRSWRPAIVYQSAERGAGRLCAPAYTGLYLGDFSRHDGYRQGGDLAAD